jgi:CRP/FNR family transcriptional regulator, cyclic AMP receptor protein
VSTLLGRSDIGEGNGGNHPAVISSYSAATRRQLLSKHFLISTMPERALDDLVKFSTVSRFEPHQAIFSKGDPGDCLYGILSGRVRIYATSPEGSEITLNVQEPGELCGEIALLDGNPRTASAAAMDETELLCIHRDHFLPYVRANPDLVLGMVSLLCRRLRWTSSAIEDAAFLAF